MSIKAKLEDPLPLNMTCNGNAPTHWMTIALAGFEDHTVAHEHRVVVHVVRLLECVHHELDFGHGRVKCADRNMETVHVKCKFEYRHRGARCENHKMQVGRSLACGSPDETDRCKIVPCVPRMAYSNCKPPETTLSPTPCPAEIVQPFPATLIADGGD